MTHAYLIQLLEKVGIPTSPFMHYWLLEELQAYVIKHMGLVPRVV